MLTYMKATGILFSDANSSYHKQQVKYNYMTSVGYFGIYYVILFHSMPMLCQTLPIKVHHTLQNLHLNLPINAEGLN